MKETDTMQLASQVMELSDTKSYIELTNRLCWYDAPNANQTMLPSKGALEKAETLVNQPVVAKYKKIAGKDDLGGHEAYYDPVTQEVEFATQNVGTHTAVEIKDDEVEINGEKKTLPCLFATSRIWKKRNKNVVNAVTRLFNEGKLYTSWEISAKKYEFADGIKTLTDYEFLGNCLLGSQTPPAYSSAVTLNVASLAEADEMIAEAFGKDIQIQLKKEAEMEEKKITVENEETSEDVKKKKKTVDAPVEFPSEPEPEPNEDSGEDEDGNGDQPGNDSGENGEGTGGEDSGENPADPDAADQPANGEDNGESGGEGGDDAPSTESSSLTLRDVAHKIERALWKNNNELNVVFIFPEEHTFLCREWGMNELDFLQGTYEADEDEITVSQELIPIRLVASVREINEKYAEMNSALAKANSEINSLKEEVGKLTPYKEQAEKEAAEKAEAEKNAKIAELKAYAISSKLISAKEIEAEGSEIGAFIAELDKQAVDNLIGSRFMQKRNSEDGTETAEASAEQKKGVIARVETDEDSTPFKKTKTDDAFYAYINK